jgi:hypothetical protein
VTEAAGAPASAPKPINPWVIVIVVIVLVCCFCFGALGLLLAFGEPILQELGLISALLPVMPLI